MRTHIVAGFQVVGVAHKSQHFEPPVVKSEQCANAHIVNTLPELCRVRLSDSRNRLFAAQVVGFVSFPVGMFPEKPEKCLFRQLSRAETFNFHRSGVDIHPADFAVSFFHAVCHINCGYIGTYCACSP